jgi:hypothetical protein
LSLTYTMRFLNTLSFELEEFHNTSPPQYAILSHTWGSEEVSYQEMVRFSPTANGVRRSTEGFRKIELSCQRALRDGLRYIWIDTCCIDKTSSAELSEAINSMFSWYQRANVCYAYLSDVPEGFEALPDLGDGHALSSNEEEELMLSTFSQSRWFTRGWTLQELIAPAEVKFYSNNFGFIGSKKTLAYLISRITSIDEAVLLGEQPIQAFCIARKMSWAAKRMTTRLEDVAYSLLGIFGVNMPLLYGEGKRAYLRLQQEIIKSYSDQSIFAWEDNVAGGRTLFASSPNSFEGSKNIVIWHGEKANESFMMTNRGLSLRLPFVETIGEHGQLQRRGVLGCRYEDDLSGPIGLNLEKMTRLGGYPLAFTGPKLSVVPLVDVASAAYKPVSIVERYDPRADFERAPPIQGNQKCWIKFLGTNAGFSIAEAHPRRFWNARTGVFIPPRGSNIAGGAHFRSNDGMEFTLTFGYVREGALLNTTRFHSEWVTLAKPVEGRSLEQLCMSSSIEQANNTWGEIQLAGIRNFKIEASINADTVMDETVFVISVRVSETV